MIQQRNIAFPDHIFMSKMNKKPIQLKVAFISYIWDISICPCSIIAPDYLNMNQKKKTRK